MNEHSNEVNQNKEANSEFDVYQCIKQKQDKHQHWRRSIHQHPELGFEEHTTSAFVVSKLKEWDIEVVEGIAGTGVVGKLRVGDGQKAIGLRADMDALAMQELNEFSHRSQVDGKFHGCGHDGHHQRIDGEVLKHLDHRIYEHRHDEDREPEVVHRDRLCVVVEALLGLGHRSSPWSEMPSYL